MVLGYGLIDSERRMRERHERALGGRADGDDEDVENQHAQIIKFIAALGEKHHGSRAILKVMAVKQGISSDQDIDELLDGSADRRIQVPVLGNVLKDIGPGEVMAPLNMVEILSVDEPLLMAGES